MIKRTVLYFIVLALSISGCAYPIVSHYEVTEGVKSVDASDGIDKLEATLIAQNLIVTKSLGSRLYTLKPFDVRYQATWDSKDGQEEMVYVTDTFQRDVDKRWTVLFREKSRSLFWGIYPLEPFYVEVDGDTGKILGWGFNTDERYLY